MKSTRKMDNDDGWMDKARYCFMFCYVVLQDMMQLLTPVPATHATPLIIYVVAD